MHCTKFARLSGSRSEGQVSVLVLCWSLHVWMHNELLSRKQRGSNISKGDLCVYQEKVWVYGERVGQDTENQCGEAYGAVLFQELWLWKQNQLLLCDRLCGNILPVKSQQSWGFLCESPVLIPWALSWSPCDLAIAHPRPVCIVLSNSAQHWWVGSHAKSKHFIFWQFSLFLKSTIITNLTYVEDFVKVLWVTKMGSCLWWQNGFNQFPSWGRS